ncbi:hypothetical protein PPERSA_01062 [Pseudocohnilembus persalinus]|uniref:Uncharacterized protein n=1 Tax=Pseudocohnilembus persalinus TaxID=266149 RepID=A0A0V0QVF6_PSEPJ|nr:hypothetical protein PPERSA_01062 [Pseudocohnilembus persalinus]|eukprot:KRX05984.1 hypothetical protein PPERSA_01062 [Pseudocohnilembus persalinus]
MGRSASYHMGQVKYGFLLGVCFALNINGAKLKYVFANYSDLNIFILDVGKKDKEINLEFASLAVEKENSGQTNVQSSQKKSSQQKGLQFLNSLDTPHSAQNKINNNNNNNMNLQSNNKQSIQKSQELNKSVLLTKNTKNNNFTEHIEWAQISKSIGLKQSQFANDLAKLPI